jgi:hypothetical protein
MHHGPITVSMVESAFGVKQNEGEHINTEVLMPILNSVTTGLYGSTGKGVGVLVTRCSKNNDLHTKSISVKD